VLQSEQGGLPDRAELTAVPYFAQQSHQCGPAALAMALRAAGIAATPESLAPQVFLPQREGSLQAELLAGARRSGALAMSIPRHLPALLAEVAAGTPVIVLQNLGLDWMPRWHYAVVIGYDLAKEEILLRSGAESRQAMPLSTFEHTWRRGGYWGMVVLQPDRLPVTAEEATAVAAAVAFEKTNPPASARQAYQAALERWPGNAVRWIGLGNTAYAVGDRMAAAAAFRRATEENPGNAAAFNNLASILAEIGEFTAARRAAQVAVQLGGLWRDAATATLREIDSAQRRARR
jgi:tetratricopeptide (TPR) repeat protein